ncbi:MAG: protein kinase [Gammaproteobacteria bacterium]|nr:protein kinase [Gammaproteobacteria bacterium]
MPFDLGLSACAIEGQGGGHIPPPERRRNDRRRAPTNPTSNAVRLTVGHLLGGRYRIERELGEGGMGVVYLAADEQVHGEKFAIKVLKEKLRPEALALLREEVRQTRKLSHQNIVDVHSVNLDGDKLYVLMEYLEGKSLDRLLDEEFGRGMPFSHAWPIIEDVAAALGNAHDHNVIHSDVKPANVFLTSSGRTKLLDFGIARVSRGRLLHSPPGTRALTPGYASCEMLEGKEADRRDDIYSFACVIYEMLSGERPFGDLTALEAREAGTRIAPIEGLSREQNAVLMQALSFSREGRIASVEKLLAGLAGRASRGRPAALLGAAIIAVVGAAGLTYLALDRLGGSRHVAAVAVTAPSSPQAPSALPVVPTTAAFNPLSRSIAVLPFVNMSGDPKQEYFSDGLSEELIDHLVHGSELNVIARTSSFQFRGRNEDVRSIARTLNVAHVLEGSVRKEGQQLRITAQLVRGSDGVQMWSQSYDRSLVDIFKVQDEIAEKVAQALRVSLQARTVTPQPDVRAYNLVLEGNYLKARRTLHDVQTAAQLYQQAIEIKPDYALAWARLASAYLQEEMLQGPPSEDWNRRVVDALDRAIRLDPNLVWAYLTRGGFELDIKWDWAAAQADDARVREIDPLFLYLPNASGDVALVLGDVDRAIELYRDGLSRSPIDPYILGSLGEALCAANRFEECLQLRLKLQQLNPQIGGIDSAIAMARLHLGQLNAAFEALQREPDENYRLRGLAIVYAALGRRVESDGALDSLAAKFAARDPYGIAQVHAYRHELDDAFSWLERAYRAHDSGMLAVKTDPLLRNLHGDPRFQTLLSRMKLTTPGVSEGMNSRT